KENETLKGVLKITSSKVDLNEWMSTGEPSATPSKVDTSSMSIVEIPDHIDFTMSASINTLLYQNITMSNVVGNIIIKDKAIRMSNVMMHLLDGSLAMNGGYSTLNPKKPVIDFDLAVSDFDIQKTAST